MIDDVTGEQYDIVLDNFPAAEQPVILASGSDGVVYSYEYDAASDFYLLTSTSVDAIAADNGFSAMGIAGGALAAAAAIGIAVGAGGGGGGGKSNHSSDDSNAGSGQAGLLRDEAGNILTNGSTLTDNTPTFSGEGMKPGSTVVIKDGDTVIGEATVDEDGKWSLTPDEPLADGDHSIVIDGTDVDGKETSETVDVIIDTNTDTPAGDAGETDAPSDGGADAPADGGSDTPEAPEDPTKPGLIDDAGNPIADGGTTSDSTPTIGGGGMEPGSDVTITDGDKVIGEVTVDEDGNWTFTPDEPLDDGDHALVIDGTDANGNDVSNTVDIVVDTDATTPGLTDDAGHPINDGDTTNDSTPTIGGGGMEPGSTVTITDGDEVIGEVTVDEDGNWTFTPDEPLADGDHALVIDGTDANGNDVNDTVNIVVDPTKPDLTDDAGNPINNGDTTSDSTPTIGGGGMEPGSDVTITDGDKVIGEVTVDEDGNWTFTPDEPLADGDHALVIDGTDANGDDVSKTVDIVVDTEASTPGLTDDAGNPIEDGGTTSDSTPTIGGGGMEPGSDVTITDGDKVIGEVTVDEDGNWTFTPDEPLADGDHALIIDGTDANGNNVNDTVNIVVDTEASTPGLTDDAGNPIEDGTTTSDTTPTIGGGGMEPGSDVTITDGDKVIGEVTVDEDGNWTFTPDEPLADGDHALVIDGTDANGNNVNDTVNIVVDTEATDPVLTDDGGRVIADGGTTTDSTPTIGGGGMEPGSTVTISDGDKVIGEVTVDEDGNWTFTPDEPLADGNHAITIDGTNTDGNTASDTVNIVVDTGASDQVIIDDTGKVISDGGITSDSTPTIGGQNMEPGSTVTISDGDTVLGEATVGDDGKWSFTPDQPLADGDHTITIAGTDANGNATSDTTNIVVDTEASTPVLTDDAGNALEDDATTSDSTPTFGGEGMKPGSTVTITDGDKAIGEATVGDDGSWSFTPDQPLADG
ncbi:Ig-like domain-containing protein, partial [Pantoea sp. BAV 3049]|uniref:Ig-like domain-containing protein n=1 Tax=Pantoea sp. BAV 3049 TaxID=2654188 RepID=UPI001E3D3AF9